MADPAPAKAKNNERVITCTNKKNPGKAVTLRVSTNANASAAAPMAPVASVPAVSNGKGKADKKAAVDAIIADIEAAAGSVTKATLADFNGLLTRYNAALKDAMPTTAVVVEGISESLTDDAAIKGAAGKVVLAVKAVKMEGGRRKTHRKKHGMRHSKRHCKRHCKTHKKHGGKRSKTHRKRHGKHSKHSKRSRKHRRM